MAFAWAELLAVAEHLATASAPTCTREAVLRSVVGRAYYAAFGVAREYAASTLDFRVHARPDDHERLPWRLIGHGLPLAGTRLQTLRSWRNDCDYADDVHNLETIAIQSIERARLVIEELESRPTSG